MNTCNNQCTGVSSVTTADASLPQVTQVTTSGGGAFQALLTGYIKHHTVCQVDSRDGLHLCRGSKGSRS